MKVLEKGFLNNAKGIELGEWIVEKNLPNNLDAVDIARLAEMKAKWTEKTIRENGGTRIQIEDWSEDYNYHSYADVVATYPRSKIDMRRNVGPCYPQFNKSFRCAFVFGSGEEAKDAYCKLLNGEKTLLDYVANLEKPEFADCI